MSTDSIVAWLLSPDTGAATEELLAGLAARLDAEGLSILRASLSVPTLHPELSVHNVAWTQETGSVATERDQSLLTTPFYLDSAPFPAAGDEASACRRALTAAKAAIVDIRRWNETREEAIGVGVALHLGDVTYGNVGAQRRLDFTVIGAAVNEVCRVEPLCKALGRGLLVTDAFAARVASGELVALGTHTLRGVAEPRVIFGVEGY